jgi:hypothetical protein
VGKRSEEESGLSAEPRRCPICDSENTTLVQRGLAGATDEHDQYYTCDDCGRVTYEIVSRTPKDVRIGRMEAGRQVKVAGFEYLVSRVLKVGLNESLVYLKPVAPDPKRSATPLRPSRR